METHKINRIFNQLGLLSTWGYIFFSIVPHAAAGKYIASGLMLVAFLGLLLRNQINRPEPNLVNTGVFFVVGLALLSAVLTPYSAESLNQFRKEGLPFLVGFILLTNTNEENRNKTAIYTLLSLLFGYAVKEILAIWAGIANGFQFSIYESPDTSLPKYLDFFSADTPSYLPFLLGPLCFWPMRLWQRAILLGLTGLAVAIVLVSGVRTAFVLVVFSTLMTLIYRFWSQKKTVLTGIVLVALSGFFLKDQITSPSIARYSTIGSIQTYQFGKDGSVSERYAIIKGVWEVSKGRLLFGYGPGWKKLPTVASENGHMQRWEQSSDPIDGWTFRYFSHGEGRVNPHNFYVGLIFEYGILGLIAYVFLMLTVAVSCLKILFNQNDLFQKGLAVAGVLYMLVYFAGSLAGGAWLPVTMLVLTVFLTLYKHETLVFVDRTT